MVYRLFLVRCGYTGDELTRAEETFRDTLEAKLGGPWAVVEAYRASTKVIGPDSRTPVPPRASDPEREAVKRWRSAVAAGFATIYSSLKFTGSRDDLANTVGAAHVRMEVVDDEVAPF